MLLALREPLHGWIEKLTWPELRSALVLLAMTFIALPIMPEGPVGPFGGVNPREVWIIAIVLAGASSAMWPSNILGPPAASCSPGRPEAWHHQRPSRSPTRDMQHQEKGLIAC
jgi:hypothetical protein